MDLERNQAKVGYSKMEKVIFWTENVENHLPYRGGMYVRSDLGKTLKKWTDKGLKIVGIAIDGSMEVEFILDDIDLRNDEYLLKIRQEEERLGKIGAELMKNYEAHQEIHKQMWEEEE